MFSIWNSNLTDLLIPANFILHAKANFLERRPIRRHLLCQACKMMQENIFSRWTRTSSLVCYDSLNYHRILLLFFAVIAPWFHALYWEAMVKVFTQCSEISILKIEELLHGKKTVELDLEAEFSSFALDIIGLGVFNYDFGSVTKESTVIKVW